MENKPSDLRELLWRRKPSATEHVKLHAQPELQIEARLTEALAKISDVAVPSNLTARVLAAIELEETRTARSCRHWNWHSWLPRLAFAAAALVFAGVIVQRHEIHSQRAELARTLVAAAGAQLPSTDALENLDAIQRMAQSGHADGELLAALQ